MDFIDQIVGGLFADFTNPKKRVFVGYLALSVLIAVAWLIFAHRTTARRAFARIFGRKIWFSGSALADYKIFVINRAFTGFVSPLLLTQLGISTAIYMALVRSDLTLWGAYADAPKGLVIAAFSAAMFLADDFTKYLLHRWMHRWPALWAIHKVHHSAETLTPITVYRIHPLEGVLYASRNAVAQGSVISVFYYLFGNTVDLYTILGVNALVFAFHITGSNLRHSHIDIRYPKWLEHILISPAQHQVHHSVAVKHYDKNYGAALAVWDWLFGSLHVSEGQHDMKFGLREGEQHSATSLRVMYLRPLVEIYRLVKNTVLRISRRISRHLVRTEP